MTEDTDAPETILEPILNFWEKYGRDRVTHDEVKHLGIFTDPRCLMESKFQEQILKVI